MESKRANFTIHVPDDPATPLSFLCVSGEAVSMDFVEEFIDKINERDKELEDKLVFTSCKLDAKNSYTIFYTYNSFEDKYEWEVGDTALVVS